jgi:hypothetical protein
MMVVPSTLDRLTHTIQVLQQLQRLLTVSATLADVADVLACIEAEFGAECLLEDVIQSLVGEHIALQLARRPPCQSNQVKLEVAA